MLDLLNFSQFMPRVEVIELRLHTHALKINGMMGCLRYVKHAQLHVLHVICFNVQPAKLIRLTESLLIEHVFAILSQSLQQLHRI